MENYVCFFCVYDLLIYNRPLILHKQNKYKYEDLLKICKIR